MEHRIYFGCRVRQRIDGDTTYFFVFYARVKDIKQWAIVRRAQDSQEGTQRLLRETRRKAITRFVRSDAKNTIPNNILLAFEPEKAKFTSLDDKLSGCLSEVNTHNSCEGELEWGILEFSFNNSENSHCAYVVDGQHRLQF